MDEETLTRLLKGEHLDMPYRLARELWPHPPIPYGRVLRLLIALLEQNRWFPLEPKSETGETCLVPATIERVSETRYVYRSSSEIRPIKKSFSCAKQRLSSI